ncbi:MAG TPA: hypothetical protein VMN57_12715 [Anaerolineales bacterium]|nr:hypothetical protein [Anaerolineales bacterium]
MWCVADGSAGDRPSRGLNSLALVALTAAARLLLETFRGESLLQAAGLRAAQVIALTILRLALSLMRKWALNEQGI